MSGLTDNQIAIGKRMLDTGATWTAIAAQLHASMHNVQVALKPGYRERRREQDRRKYGYRVRKPKSRYSDGPILGHRGDPRTVTPAEAERALATVPMDTRDLTARLFGDPLPGRSALDARGAP